MNFWKNLTPATRQIIIICGTLIVLCIVGAAVYTGNFGELLNLVEAKK